MHYGVFIFATDFAIRIDELARAAEQRGLESLFVPEHTHIPKSRRSPWPGGPSLPKEYWHTHDPFVALATAAAVTTTRCAVSGEPPAEFVAGPGGVVLIRGLPAASGLSWATLPPAIARSQSTP